MRAGRDVVVHAPTGSGKTYVFELLYPSLKGQAVYTVPTRALANDKYAEWRAAGWDVGITTGDVSERPEARVVVEDFRRHYNERRPHSKLGYQSPACFVALLYPLTPASLVEAGQNHPTQLQTNQPQD